uniref:Uncharacterized protein n=1 Tax=Romanomermis culicivorax TaxID=13658 RepID=A0A915HUQ2_ROMCU
MQETLETFRLEERKEKMHLGDIMSNPLHSTGVGCATADGIGGRTTTTTAAACAAPVSKAGCCVLTTGAGACGCVLTCPDPPACTVWDTEGRFKGFFNWDSDPESRRLSTPTSTPTGGKILPLYDHYHWHLFKVYSTPTPLHQ